MRQPENVCTIPCGSRCRHIGLLMALFWLAILVLPGNVRGQQVSDVPWIDNSGQVVPWGLTQREDAASKDRDVVPVAPIRPPAPVLAPMNRGFGSVSLVYILVALGILLAVGLSAWLFVSARIKDGADDSKTRKRTLAESIQHLPFELDAGHGDFRQQAWAAYETGDLRRSLILLFSHVLVTLDQRNLVYLKKGKTNRQYLRELKQFPQLAGYYGDLMVPFEQAFFGDHPVPKSVCENCWQGLEDFHNQISSAVAAKVGQND